MRFDVPFSLRAALLTLSVVLALSTRAHSEMVRFELERREAYAGGRSFGEHGSYEMLRGRAYFEVDPKIVFMTGVGENSDTSWVEASGACDILLKPIAPSSVTRLLKIALPELELA